MGFEISADSKADNIIPNKKELKTASAQVQQKSVFEKERPTVVVIDDFANKKIPVDPYDHTPDMPHGYGVEAYMKTQCPAVNIKRMGVFNSDPTEEISNNMHKLSESVSQGENTDAVNMSFKIADTIENLAKKTGLPLNNKNIYEYREQILDWIKKNDYFPIGVKLKDRIDDIETITAKGIPVYTSAGNEGKGAINLLSLAKGVKTVGALTESGRRTADYSDDNTLVNRWEIGTYSIKEVKNPDGEAGYDFTGDNKPEILKKDTSNNIFSLSRFLFGKIDKIYGTSFSTPVALGKDLRKKYGDACDQ